jgi:hypothetical protein
MPRNLTHKIFLGLVIAIGVFMLFANLCDRLLWQDEAEVALLARSITQHSVPVAWDGRNIDTQQSGTEFDDNFIWRWSAWGTMYLAYIGTRIFGETPFGFRFHGALFGLLTLIAAYFTARRWMEKSGIALFSIAVLLFATPLVLYSRQCRYYSVISFFGTLALWAYPGLSRRRDFIVFVLSAAAMIYFNELSAGILMAGAIAYSLLLEENRTRWRRVLMSLPIIAVLALPQLIQRLLNGGRAAAWHDLGFYEFGRRLLKGIFEWNNVIFPFITLAVLWIIRKKLSTPTRRILGFLTCMIITCQFFVAPFLDPNIRYALFALVLAAMLAASAISDIFAKNRVAAILTAAVFFGTNLFAAVPIIWLGKWFPSERILIFREITTHYRGPTEAVVEFLNSNAREGEVVLTEYEQLPLMVHTKLAVANMLPEKRAKSLGLPRYVYDPMTADWVIPKINYCVDCPRISTSAFLKELKKKGAKLTAYPLKVKDLKYGNAPNLTYHLFESPETSDDGITVYKVERKTD